MRSYFSLKENKKSTIWPERTSRDLMHLLHAACLGATQVSVRLAPAQSSFHSSTRRINWCRFAGSTLLPRVRVLSEFASRQKVITSRGEEMTRF